VGGVRSFPLGQLQRVAGHGAVGWVLQRDALSDQVISGQFKEALVYLNGLPMEHMLDRLERLGFANASYLLANLSAAAGLGSVALARLESAIRTVGLGQTGTTAELLPPLLDAVGRAELRKYADQYAAVKTKVRAPSGGWSGLIQQNMSLAELSPFLGLILADNVFRVIDFVSDGDMRQTLGDLTESELRLLITNIRFGERYDDERIRRALDAAWRARFPKVEPPWPKPAETGGLNVAGMSSTDKLAWAVRTSPEYGGEELSGKLSELLSPSSLAFMVGTTIIFAVLEMGTGGAAGVALLLLSAALVGPEVYTVAGDIKEFIVGAVNATDEQGLRMAAQHFARAAIAISVDILIAVLLHKPTKIVTPKIQAGARYVGSKIAAAAKLQLLPALAIGPEGIPFFVEAPPDRLTSLESRGGGGGGKPVDYSKLSIKTLKKLAETDREAFVSLALERYFNLPMARLRAMARGGNDAARWAAEQRIRPNDDALIKAQGSDYRPPHAASAWIARGGHEVSRTDLVSGNITDAEAALGWPRSMLASHTEARAVNLPDLQRGDTLGILGQYDPCPGCVVAMQRAAAEHGITVEYHWADQVRSFVPMRLAPRRP
jgi:hypothetical protein